MHPDLVERRARRARGDRIRRRRHYGGQLDGSLAIIFVNRLSAFGSRVSRVNGERFGPALLEVGSTRQGHLPFHPRYRYNVLQSTESYGMAGYWVLSEAVRGGDAGAVQTRRAGEKGSKGQIRDGIGTNLRRQRCGGVAAASRRSALAKVERRPSKSNQTFLLSAELDLLWEQPRSLVFLISVNGADGGGVKIKVA